VGFAAEARPAAAADEQPAAAAEARPAAAADEQPEADEQTELLRARAQALADAAIERCAYFEGIFSRTLATSDVARINAADGASVKVAPETAELIARGIAAGELTGGLFDITIGAAANLWDFKNEVVPSAEALRAAVSHIDYRKVIVDATTVTLLDPAAKLDLGGIAKGYIADALARLLREQGCASALINLGGNVYALGGKPDGEPFNVGLRDPDGAAGEIFASAPVRDLSVVTSGPYERGFVDTQTGAFYHHILDARTGYPVGGSLAGASILSASSVDGDIFSTTCFLLGDERALSFLQQQPDAEGILINDNALILATSGAVYELA
jgi:thiamine biosynthesis lipoprotein